MIITIVMDQFGSTNNGTTVTAMRFAEVLKKHGHTVRIVATKPEDSDIEDENFFPLERYHIPIFDNLIISQGMVFAKPNDEVLRKAIQGADVVHMLLPFPVQRRARLIAKDLGVATTAAFHLQPENITYTCYLGKNKPVNSYLYRHFRKSFYNFFKHVHCPSIMIRDQLIKHKYKNELHVISNGVAPSFVPSKSEKPEEYKDRFVILMIGRLSREKRQDILIEAIGKSKYRDKIQLILCGKGPWKGHLESLGKKNLAYPINFAFLPQPELLKVINYADLYVHASDAEIEAISCMEAFTCGLVPIISDSELTATKQFAQDPHCLFKKGDSDSLSAQIDYFYENPEEKARLSKVYIEYAKQYALDYCVSQLEKVFQKAIEENAEEISKRGCVPLTRKEERKINKIDKEMVKKLKQAAKKNNLDVSKLNIDQFE